MGCSPSGRPAIDPWFNQLKNRIDQAPNPTAMTIQQFIRLSWPKTISGNLLPMEKWSTSERRAVYRYEGMAVSVIGYFASVKQEGPESPNCDGQGGIDWHLWVAAAAHSGRGQAVITESTPRVRAREHGFDFNALAGLLARGSKIRVTGWTLLDYEHPEQLGWDRATLWEIHPVTKIESWRNGHWMTVAG